MSDQAAAKSKLEATKKKVQQYDYIRFALCDINGTYRGQVVSSRHVDSYLEDGVDLFEGILVAGPRADLVFIEHEYNYQFGSMSIIPDLDTLRPIPWAEGRVKVAEFLCESRWKNGIPQAACPRYVARQQIQRLKDLGYDLYSGYELEFKVYEKESLKPLYEGNDAYGLRVFNQCSKIIFDFDRNFRQSELDVERFHCEMEEGTFEAITKPKYGIKSMDTVLNMKQSLMEMADLKGLVVSFMSKQANDKEPTGIATHLNISLWDESGKNVFYDDDSPDKLSTTAKHWIAGILKHSKALCAFTSPTVNCYRRLHQPFFVSSITWGIQDRLSILRIKNHGPKQTYMEMRAPSGKSNPYLVAAATIAAGLDGVEKKLKCPPPGKGEKDESLPRSLSEALDELEADTDLVDALGKEFVTWFVKCKKDGEIIKYVGLDTDEKKFALEKEKYFL